MASSSANPVDFDTPSTNHGEIQDQQNSMTHNQQKAADLAYSVASQMMPFLQVGFLASLDENLEIPFEAIVGAAYQKYLATFASPAQESENVERDSPVEEVSSSFPHSLLKIICFLTLKI